MGEEDNVTPDKQNMNDWIDNRVDRAEVLRTDQDQQSASQGRGAGYDSSTPNRIGHK